METVAIHRHARISAQKVRLVANQIRGLHVEKALDLLKYSPLKAAGFITRDSRVVERKKYGRAKARKSFQFSKR